MINLNFRQRIDNIQWPWISRKKYDQVLNKRNDLQKDNNLFAHRFNQVIELTKEYKKRKIGNTRFIRAVQEIIK